MAQDIIPIPEGYGTLTPSIVVSDCARALDFYKRAFGAVETGRFPTPDGKIAHAEIQIGNSRLMVADDFPFYFCHAPDALGGTTTTFYLYTDDVDALFNRAVQAGATVKLPLKDQFWGDRTGHLADPFGHIWALAMHNEDVSPEEMQRRGTIELAKMGQRTQTA